MMDRVLTRHRYVQPVILGYIDSLKTKAVALFGTKRRVTQILILFFFVMLQIYYQITLLRMLFIILITTKLQQFLVKSRIIHEPKIFHQHGAEDIFSRNAIILVQLPKRRLHLLPTGQFLGGLLFLMWEISTRN